MGRTTLDGLALATVSSGHVAPGPPATSGVLPLTQAAVYTPAMFVYVAPSANMHPWCSHTLADEAKLLRARCFLDVKQAANLPAKPAEDKPLNGADVVSRACVGLARVHDVSHRVKLENGTKSAVATGDGVDLCVTTGSPNLHQAESQLLQGPDLVAVFEGKRPSPCVVYKVGDPVAIASGAVVDDETDLGFPGRPRLAWSRAYSSARAAERGALGRGGWMHAFEQRIELDAAGAPTLIDGFGAVIPIPLLATGGEALLRARRLAVRRTPAGFEVDDLDARLRRIFTTIAPDGSVRLSSIRDAYGARLDVAYDGELVAAVHGPDGRSFVVSHDPRGCVARVAAVVDGVEAQAVEYAYAEGGELELARDGLGREVRFEYDGLHRLVRKTLRSGLAFHYDYDDIGRCVRSRGDGDLQRTEIHNDRNGRAADVTGNPEARTIAWDERGEVVRIATLDGSAAEEVERDGDGLVVARTDAAGRRVTYEYDARGNRVRAVAPTGDTVAWEYAGDLPVGRTGADGSTAKCAWDERGAPKSYTNELGVRFDYEVDGRGRLVAVDGPEGRIESYHFDEHGDVDTVVDARGGEWRYRFDPMGRVIAATDPLGRETVWQRDAIGRVIGERLPDGTELRYEHDAYDRAIAITDADGVGPRAELAPSGGVLSATTSAGERWRVERDVLERPTRLTSPKQETHRYRYDRVGRVAEETTFDGRTSRYRYDRSGRLVRVEHGDDSWEEIEHDERGYVLRRRFADATHTWERDALGRPVAAIAEDAAGRVVVEWAWSDRGLLRSEAVDGRVVEHEYDALGRRIARRLPNGEVTRYRYDPAGAVIEIGHEGARIVIERDVLGRERRRRLGVAGLSVTTEYSMDDRPSRRVLVNAEGRTLRRREWAYGPHARLVRATDDRFGTTEYEHDLRGRLVGTRRAAAGELFEYDAAGSLSGRRPRRRPAGRPFTHAKGGLLLESDRATYEYDPRGRRRRRTVAHPGGQAAVTEYAWDSADRLREVRASDGTRVRFAYDVLGRRVCKVIEAASDAGGAPRRVDFVWDGLELAMELDSSGSERSFVHAPGPFVPVLVRDAGATRYCITDRLGALGDLVDETGEIAWSGELSPWGELTRSEGAAPPPPFRLLGQYADDETGLLYVFQRWFDPEVARWLSPDPLGIDGGLGLYAFDGSPTEQVDPLGLMTRPDFEKRMNDSAGRRESAHDATERAREKLLAGEKGELADREKTVSVSSDGRTAETRDGVHAEQQIVDATKTEGSPKGDLGGEAVGASHPHCANCVNAIVGAGGVTADRISARGPDGNKDLFSPDKFPRTNGQVWGGTGGEPLGGAS